MKLCMALSKIKRGGNPKDIAKSIAKDKKAANTGISRHIKYLGHKKPKRNPALNAWKAGVACHKDWKPESGGKLSVEWLYDTFYVRDELQNIKKERERRALQSAADKQKYQEKLAQK